MKHCRIQKEGQRYLLGTTTEFDSLVELVNYFRKKPLYRKIKLCYPVTPELVERFSMVSVCGSTLQGVGVVADTGSVWVAVVLIIVY